MTLIVVCLDKESDSILALADTRVSDTVGTLTDFSPKMFSLPIRETIGDPKNGESIRWECGFAFAGHVTAANFVYSASSAVLTNINRNEGSNRVSLYEICEIVRRIYENIFYDICFRKPYQADFILNSSVSIFGYCPIEKKLNCFVIRSGFVAGHPTVALTNIPLTTTPAILGSGKKAFEDRRMLQIKATGQANIFKAFCDVIYDDNITDVGGSVQILRSTRNGVFIPPVLNRTDNPDGPDFKIFGVPTDNLIPKDRLTIGYQGEGATFYGFGIEQAANRTYLRRLGYDPESTSITKREINTAAIFGAVSSIYANRASKISMGNDIYPIAALKPIKNKAYYGCICPRCKTFNPVIPNTDEFHLNDVWSGSSMFNIICCSCSKSFNFPPNLLFSAIWTPRMRKSYSLWTTTCLQ